MYMNIFFIIIVKYGKFCFYPIQVKQKNKDILTSLVTKFIEAKKNIFC